MKKSKTKTQVSKKTALASGNGFSYQAYDFLCKLLKSVNEIVSAGYEGIQDYHIELLNSKIVCFQIKNINGIIYPASFVKQINQFWKEINKDKNKKIDCCYISNEKVSNGLVNILEIWNKELCLESDVDRIVKFLLGKRIDNDLVEFIQSTLSRQNILRESLVEKMKWRFNDKVLRDVVNEGIEISRKFIEQNNNFKGSIDPSSLFSRLKTRFDIEIDDEVKKGNHFIKLTAANVLQWHKEILQQVISSKDEDNTLTQNEILQPIVEFESNNIQQTNDIFDAEEALLKKTKTSSTTSIRIDEIVRNLSFTLKNSADAARNLILMKIAIKDVIFAKCDCGLDEAKKSNPYDHTLQTCIDFMSLNELSSDKNRYWQLLSSLIDLELKR